MENLFRLTITCLFLVLLSAPYAGASSRKDYINKHISKSEWEAFQTLGLADMERFNGEYSKALEYTRDSLRALRSKRKTEGFLFGLANAHAGILCLELGHFKEARKYSLATLEVAERLDNDELRLMSLGELAILYAISGDRDAYMEWSGKVIAVLGIESVKRGPSTITQIRDRLKNVLVFYDVDEYLLEAAKNHILVEDSEAARLFLETILADTSGKKPIRDLAASILGELLISSGELKDVEKIAQSYDNEYVRGRLAYEGGKYDDAVNHFTASLSNKKFGEVDYLYAKNLYLAKAYEKAGEIDEAINFYGKANDIVETSRNSLLLPGRKAYLAMNEFNVLRSEAHEGLARIYMNRNEKESSFDHSEFSKCRTLIDTLHADNDDAGNGFFSSIFKSKKDSPVGLDELDLDPEAYLVSFDVTETALMRYVIHKGEIVMFDSLPVTRKDLMSQVSEYLQSFAIQSHADLSKFSPSESNKLFFVLFNGVIEVVPAGAKLVISPDEFLCQISFASLVTATDPKHYLVERNRLLTCLSASLYSNLRNKKRTSRQYHIAVVDPDFNLHSQQIADSGEGEEKAFRMQAVERRMQLPPLPETQRILTSLAKVFPGTSKGFSGLDANWDTVQSLDFDEVRTLTIATHAEVGRIDVYTMEPSIHLSQGEGDDGVVTLSEIEDKKIAPECCFLAACQTGIGEYLPGEGPQSFVYAFHKNGTANVISSMWPVEVNSTVQLVSEFYANLRSGKSYSEALQKAQLDLMRKKK